MGLNGTQNVLIPKVKRSITMSELQLSPLCNVIYKIMAKILAN